MWARLTSTYHSQFSNEVIVKHWKMEDTILKDFFSNDYRGVSFDFEDYVKTELGLGLNGTGEW